MSFIPDVIQPGSTAVMRVRVISATHNHFLWIPLSFIGFFTLSFFLFNTAYVFGDWDHPEMTSEFKGGGVQPKSGQLRQRDKAKIDVLFRIATRLLW